MKRYYDALTDRSFVRIAGEDRMAFLQGLITQDIYKLKAQPLIYSWLLTPQGKYLYDFFLFERDDTIIIDCLSDDAPKLAAKLKIYKLRSKVTIDVVPDFSSVHPVWGSDATDLEGALVDPRHRDMGVRIYGDKPAGADKADYNAHRYRVGIPEGPQDCQREKSTLQECGMEDLNAVDFKKGCYMGQELTARIHYRGLLKRGLAAFSYTGPVPNPEAPIIDAKGDEIGVVRSAHSSGRGFALIKLDTAHKGIDFKVGETVICLD